jgi:thiol-disulfide isomerase/thioredoxin
MKNSNYLFILLLVCFSGCKTVKPASEIRAENPQLSVQVTDSVTPAINFSDQTTWILGYFNPVQLTHEPYSLWYVKGYDDYQINTDAVNNLLDIGKDNLTIKIVMGTWCPDSRREVPRFMKVIDIWQFPVSKITFIGVDDAKLSPVGEYGKLDIQRVPTFIIYKNNIEAGRIIENPATSLEQDMVNILTRNEQ